MRCELAALAGPWSQSPSKGRFQLWRTLSCDAKTSSSNLPLWWWRNGRVCTAMELSREPIQNKFQTKKIKDLRFKDTTTSTSPRSPKSRS
ncbi:hypothetical protein L596_000882 [Steinernema carpocapsae]|uniref:Uncharacterized protein n=1 Tax=Steinernema carpocapsae TaxID=34508 RepID=A0A4U8UK04_STECR|nr:hypothetical protein L596_000882 [Steinernema carpocapsae]